MSTCKGENTKYINGYTYIYCLLFLICYQSNNFQDSYIQDQMRIQHISKWIIFSYSEFDQKDLNSLHIDNILFMNVLSSHEEDVVCRVRLMVFNATFNNILVILWGSALLVLETGVRRENYRPVASHWQTWSHNVVPSKPRHERDSNSQRQWW